MTREGSAARNPTGNTVPKTSGNSPKISPGRRRPTTRATPSVSLTGSIRPSSTAKQGTVIALVRRILSWHQTDICGRQRKTLALSLLESGKDADSANFLWRHHIPHPPRETMRAVEPRAAIEAVSAVIQSSITSREAQSPPSPPDLAY
jgi:hypothetical protein